MRSERKIYALKDLDSAPLESGVYAWYFRYSLTKRDIEKIIHELSGMPGGATPERCDRVGRFLSTLLFAVFQEEPYNVRLEGPLKPKYQGNIGHVPSMTTDLIRRLAQSPERLWAIKNVLEEAVPEFASPIYIGMAKGLRNRLLQHRKLIDLYKDAAAAGVIAAPQTEEEQADHSFARDVVRRRFNPNRLVVAVRTMVSDPDARVDIENILNRINFPLCGRN